MYLCASAQRPAGVGGQWVPCSTLNFMPWREGLELNWELGWKTASPREPAVSICAVMVLQIHVSVGDSTQVCAPDTFIHWLSPQPHLQMRELKQRGRGLVVWQHSQRPL